MVSAIDLLSPASSWNCLANLTRAARLASSLTILSWSFSVIEGNTSCRDDKRGDPRLSHFRLMSRRSFRTHQSPLAGARTTHIRGHTACDKVACQVPRSLGRRRARGALPRALSGVGAGRFQAGMWKTTLPLTPESKGAPWGLWPPEHGLHADREAHVALDLELAAHEGGRRVQAAGEDLHEVAGVGDERQVGGLDLALPRGRPAVGDFDEPLAGVCSRQIEQDRRARVAGLLRDEVVRHFVDDHVWRDIRGGSLVGHEILQ